MLHVTMRQLRVFSSVATHLSFARAAEEFHLTAPAVSMQIKQLEAAVGLPLLDRGRGEVSLTITGEYFLVYARRMLGTLREAENLLAKLRKVETGRLFIGMLTTAKYFLPHLLAEFLAERAGVEVRLTEGNRQTLVDALHRNELDLAIMGRPPTELDTREEAFAKHPLGVLASPRHPLAGLGQVSTDQLAREPFIIREPGSGTRLLMETCFREWRIAPAVIMQMSSNETIKQAVIANLGLSFLSLHTAADELRSGKIVALHIDTMPLVRQWHLVHLSARVLSPAAEAFRYFVLERGAAFLAVHFGNLGTGAQ
jgi:LysR family transcriptional regulator, low CO2-responsive transcriptional regulator